MSIEKLKAQKRINAANQFKQKLSLSKHYSRYDFINELGYMALTKQTAKLIFRLISNRYEAVSIIITTNKLFQQWCEVFNDDIVAAAILDRLPHHRHPFL